MNQVIQNKKQIQNSNALEQGEIYSPKHWKNLDVALTNLVADFEEREITRKDIISSFRNYYSGNSNFKTPILLCMIWGFAGIGYGNFRVNVYLKESDKIKTALDLIKSNNVEGAYKILLTVKMLGISYISKILYFAERSLKS